MPDSTPESELNSFCDKDTQSQGLLVGMIRQLAFFFKEKRSDIHKQRVREGLVREIFYGHQL
jgi:hypothetical protein